MRMLLTAAAAGLLAALFVVGFKTPEAAPQRAVAVTIDDLPLQSNYDLTTSRALTAKLLQTLTAHRIPAIGFVNEGKLHSNNDRELEARTGLLNMWLDAGMDLGNHTYSHLRYYNATLDEMQTDTLRGEAVTKRLLAERGKTLRYFRHPTLNTGKDLAAKEAFEKFLASHGYTVAPVTIDNSEWLFASEYAKARQRCDAALMKKVADAYVPYMEEVFAFYERLSRDTVGYEVKQTLLIHANALNAEHFGAVVAMLKRRGYQFISLDEALTDKAYSLPDTYTGPVGISWLQRWVISKGGQMRPEPELPPVMKAFDDPQVSGSDYKTGKTRPASRKKGKQQ